VHQPLDENAMQSAAEMLLGEHDFSAFRAAGCQASTPVRELRSVRIARSGDWLDFEITANAFLQHMVRNITGTLVTIGTGERPVEWAGQLLQGCDRRRAGIAAPARGLTLVRVSYPAPYAFPV
jgi:tRNA pseudouridine38-40 synthase